MWKRAIFGMQFHETLHVPFLLWIQYDLSLLCSNDNILRKTIEGYLDSVPSLTLNTIKTKLIMHALYSSRYLQSKWMFDLSHASVINVQYMTKWCNPLYWKVTSIQKWLKPIFIVVFHNCWLQNHCWHSAKGMTHNFVVFVSVLLPV